MKLYTHLEKEMNFQTRLLDECQQKSFPSGYLYVRNSNDHVIYYHALKRKTPNGWQTSLKNITNNPELIRSLAEKQANKKLIQICRNNSTVLASVLKKYTPLTEETVIKEKHRHIFRTMPVVSNDYQQCRPDPKSHIHETASGIMVRSKSEVIIANALWHYKIPFHYEEKFSIPDSNGEFFYPDFTIWLPDGSCIIWEHLGLLADLDYSIRTAYKLHSYQKAHFTIGKNLIITQDDWQGNCDSMFIYKIIEEYILPHFS